ncbi:GntR family transcriptional regulator [Achromobacter aloeverae]|uniref:GntR family transcriptional regulator n=2 Tax=Achromobacter aloeverae TaxID=1750518 RepID=A0A4V1MSS5_9BURK|nr:GntR family transcriptional regulator [Achromobacter aloeverae]
MPAAATVNSPRHAMSDTLNQPTSFSAIDFLRTKSLANVVQAEIERMIIDGEFQPNERVNENALSQRLGVSRGPIREACSALAAMGLIEIIPNRGFFIRALSSDESQDLSEARAGIFGCMAMMLAERVTVAQIAILRALLARMDEIVALGEVHTYYPVNLEFHKQIASMAGNNRLGSIYQSFVRELHIQRYRALSSPDVLHISNAEHREIVDAVEARDPVRALIAGRAHILNGIVRAKKAQQAGEATAQAKAAPRRTRRTAAAMEETAAGTPADAATKPRARRGGLSKTD